MKKLVSLLLVLTLVLALAVPANAEGSGVVDSIDGANDRTESAAADEQSASLVAQMREQMVMLLGGAPGQVNVLLNGRCIAFTDAVPDSRDGRTMVPLRAALEAMGATVNYDRASGSAIVTGEKVSFTHRIGSDTIVLSDGTTVQMDVASYVTSAERTMVPVRFFSQVLGYDVFWDNDYKMVFLLDRESMVRDVNENCTIVNDYLEKAAERFVPAENYREEMTFSGAVQAPGMDGAVQSYAYSGRASAIIGAEAMSAELEMERGALLAWLETATDTAFPAAYRTLLADGTMELICAEKVYARSALLDALASESGAWYVLDDTNFAALRQRRQSLGDLCYEQMLRGDENHFFESWSEAGIRAALLNALLNDTVCTTTNGAYRWSFGLDEFAQHMGGDAQILHVLGLEALSFDLTLYADGSAEAAYSFALRGSDGTTRRESAELSDSQAAAHYSKSVAQGDGFVSSYELGIVRCAADEKPAALPEDAKVIDLTAVP